MGKLGRNVRALGGGLCLVLAETILLAIVMPLVKASIGDSIMCSSVSFLIASFMSCGMCCGWNGRTRGILVSLHSVCVFGIKYLFLSEYWTFF